MGMRGAALRSMEKRLATPRRAAIFPHFLVLRPRDIGEDGSMGISRQAKP